MTDSSADVGNTADNHPANIFPPGLAVRSVRPTDNESVRALFITVQKELAPPDAAQSLRIAIKQYTDSCLNDDLARASVYYSKQHRHLWVLESQEKEIVAMVAVDADADVGNVAILRRLAVAEPFRRKGVARLLVQRTEQWASRQGYLQIKLYVTEIQPAARSLYESLGYSEKQAENYGPIAVFEMEKALAGDLQ